MHIVPRSAVRRAIFAKCGSSVFGPPPGVHQSHNFFIVIWFDLIFSAKFRGAGAKLRKKLVPTFCGDSIFQTFEPNR